jgi:hypothetical protein
MKDKILKSLTADLLGPRHIIHGIRIPYWTYTEILYYGVTDIYEKEKDLLYMTKNRPLPGEYISLEIKLERES